MQQELKKVAIYHKSCLDGSSAAAVFKMKYPDSIVIPVGGLFDEEALSEAQKYVDSNTHLYFLDNTFLLNELIDIPAKVTVIDHHESAQEIGEKLSHIKDNFEFVYSVDESGATLAWKYFFPDEELPKFLWHMRDIDLWLQLDPEKTDAVATYASMYLDDIEKFISFIHADLEEIYQKGNLLVEYRNSLVDYYLRNAQALHLKIGKHTIKAYNVASIRPIVSLFGNIVSRQTKEAVCMFKIFGKDKVNLSFRSTEVSRVKARELAEELGGGGHENAAGASIKLKDFISRIEDIKD